MYWPVVQFLQEEKGLPMKKSIVSLSVLTLLMFFLSTPAFSKTYYTTSYNYPPPPPPTIYGQSSIYNYNGYNGYNRPVYTSNNCNCNKYHRNKINNKYKKHNNKLAYNYNYNSYPHTYTYKRQQHQPSLLERIFNL